MSTAARGGGRVQSLGGGTCSALGHLLGRALLGLVGSLVSDMECGFFFLVS